MATLTSIINNIIQKVNNLTSSKVSKVTSIDNSIARFNGTAGEIQDSSVIIDDNGNINITGTGARITGDFSNSTFSNRVAFQTSTLNGSTVVSVIPNGTGTSGSFDVYNSSSMDIKTQIGCNSSESFIRASQNNGTSTYLPMTFIVGGAERMRVTAAGNLLVGTSTDNGVDKLQINGNVTAGTFNGFGGSGFKNYIINGNFNIDQYQRGTQSNWNSSVNCYTDRFLVINSSNVLRNGAGVNPIGFANHLTVYKTAGADTLIIQRWEIPKDKAKMFLNGRTLTFSCWVLSDVNNFIEYIYFIKSGTTANANEVKTFSITKNNTANIWTRITATISNIQWTYEAGDFIEIRLDPLNSTAGTIHTTGWQLEEGSVATPFEQRPYGLELSLCQRYYETSGTARCEEFRNLTKGITQYGAVRFITPKRTTPTVYVYSDNFNNVNQVAQDNGSNIPCVLASVGDSGFRLAWTNTMGSCGASFIYTASAEI